MARVTLGGVELDLPTDDDLDALLTFAMGSETMVHVTALRLRDLARARRDKRFRERLEHVAVVLPEGTARLVASKLVRAGPSLSADVLERTLATAHAHGWRVFFLGGKHSAPFDWARRARQRHPGIAIAGACAPGPDFRDDEGDERLVKRIRETGADIVMATPMTPRGEDFPIVRGPELGVHLYVESRAGLTRSIASPGARPKRDRRARKPVVLVRD